MSAELLESSRRVRGAAQALRASLGAEGRVGRMLHHAFDAIAEEPLPPDLARLADRL